MVYLDSSAIVKLVVMERESAALRAYLRHHAQRGSSSLAKVEVIRAVRSHGPAALTRARQVLRRLDLVQLDDELLDDAATLDAGILRSLDAIHLAAARLFSDDLAAIVTYDTRMAKAAARLGLPVDAPGVRWGIESPSLPGTEAPAQHGFDPARACSCAIG